MSANQGGESGDSDSVDDCRPRHLLDELGCHGGHRFGQRLPLGVVDEGTDNRRHGNPADEKDHYTGADEADANTPQSQLPAPTIEVNGEGIQRHNKHEEEPRREVEDLDGGLRVCELVRLEDRHPTRIFREALHQRTGQPEVLAKDLEKFTEPEAYLPVSRVLKFF
jgi:hypothetical protein